MNKIVTYECRQCDAALVLAYPLESEAVDIKCECGEMVGYCRINYGSPADEPLDGVTVLVKNQQWEIPPEFRTMPLGWQHGNIDHDAQEQRYGEIINDARKRTHEVARGAHAKSDFRLAAKIPRELFLARQRQYGKDYWQNEGTAALRRDNLLLPGCD